MASGYVCRANRPNTWLLRPMLQREDSPCQPGAVHTWPFASFRCSAVTASLSEQSGHRIELNGSPHAPTHVRVHYTKRQLYAMLAHAIRNAG
jgi:hypothetical protein